MPSAKGNCMDEHITGGGFKIDGWHLDKRISVGHLITTITIIISFVAWMMSMEKQMVEVRQLAISNSQRIDAMRNEDDMHYAEIIRRLERLDDRLAEYTNN